MYTVIPRQEFDDYHKKDGEPGPQIIDHRQTYEKKPDKWKDRRRKEQLPYATLKDHRDTLLNAEFKYKHRIKELEKQAEELTKAFDQTFQENKILRSIIEHGPDAVKLKKLQQDKKEQKSVIDSLKEENDDLREKFKELEKEFGAPKDFTLEKNWKDALAKAKKRRQEEDAIPTQGPFAGAKLFKPKRIAIDDERLCEQDTYDLELDTIEKETHILLNKIRQLKREKGQIDYALIMGKGSISRNTTVANAINDKLNRDLNKFAIRLEKLKLKHKAAKSYHRVMSRSNPDPNFMEESDTDTEEQELVDLEGRRNKIPSVPEKQDSDRHKSNSVTNKIDENKSNAKSLKPVSVKGSKSSRSRQSSAPAGTVSNTCSETSENKKTSQISKEPEIDKEKVPASPRKAARIENSGLNSALNASEEKKDQSKAKSPVAKINQKQIRDAMGRYSHGPEPVGKTVIKPNQYTGLQPTAGVNVHNTQAASTTIPKLKFPFNHSRLSDKTNEKKSKEEDSYDAVLEYLKRQSGERSAHRETHRRSEGNAKEYASMSPVPISFKSDGRTVNGLGPDIMGNTGLRSQEHFYKYL